MTLYKYPTKDLRIATLNKDLLLDSAASSMAKRRRRPRRRRKHQVRMLRPLELTPFSCMPPKTINLFNSLTADGGAGPKHATPENSEKTPQAQKMIP